MLLYRLVSAYNIYKQTNSIIRALLQLFDFELYRTLYVNYILSNDEPNVIQKWIQSMEATYESTPQLIIQAYFLIKTDNYKNELIVLSVIWSFISISMKAISEDKLMVYRGSESNFKMSTKYFKKFKCINKFYMLRLFWRLFDLFYRISILLLIWLFLGTGFFLIIVCFELVTLVFFSFYQKKFGHLLFYLNF